MYFIIIFIIFRQLLLRILANDKNKIVPFFIVCYLLTVENFFFNQNFKFLKLNYSTSYILRKFSYLYIYSMKNKEIEKKILTLFLLIIATLSQITDKKCCLTYDSTGNKCLTCPTGTYLSTNNCYIAIESCAFYENCFTCSQCVSGYRLIDAEVNGMKTKKC